MTKEEARKQMSRMRRDMTPQERSRQNESIRRQILADPVWKEVSWFYPFVSYGTEVDTTGSSGRCLRIRWQEDASMWRTAGQREGYGVLSDPFHGGAVSRLSGHFGTGTALSAGRSERRSDASAGACF